MKRTKTLAGVFVAALATLAMAGPAGATDDLNCGDPGTYLNMPVGPDDPHNLDSNDDGIGCEDPDAFPPGSTATTAPAETTTTTAPPAPTVPDVPDTAPPAPEPEPAAPAAPVVAEPDYTG